MLSWQEHVDGDSPQKHCFDTASLHLPAQQLKMEKSCKGRLRETHAILDWRGAGQLACRNL